MKIRLMYHDVYELDPDESGFCSLGANVYKMPKSLFEEHLKKIRSLIDDGIIDSSDVEFSFDDGGISFTTTIMPLLIKYGFHGSFFVASGMIGSNGFVSDNDIKELVKHGNYVGAHSFSHPDNILTLSKEDRVKEWTLSIRKINEIIEGKSEMISIPNGYFSKTDLPLFRDLGIKTVYTSYLGDNYCLDNIGVYGRVAMTNKSSVEYLEKILTNKLWFYKQLCKQNILIIVKTILGERYLTIKSSLLKILVHE